MQIALSSEPLGPAQGLPSPEMAGGADPWLVEESVGTAPAALVEVVSDAAAPVPSTGTDGVEPRGSAGAGAPNPGPIVLGRRRRADARGGRGFAGSEATFVGPGPTFAGAFGALVAPGTEPARTGHGSLRPSRQETAHGDREPGLMSASQGAPASPPSTEPGLGARLLGALPSWPPGALAAPLSGGRPAAAVGPQVVAGGARSGPTSELADHGSESTNEGVQPSQDGHAGVGEAGARRPAVSLGVPLAPLPRATIAAPAAPPGGEGVERGPSGQGPGSVEVPAAGPGAVASSSPRSQPGQPSHDSSSSSGSPRPESGLVSASAAVPLEATLPPRSMAPTAAIATSGVAPSPARSATEVERLLAIVVGRIRHSVRERLPALEATFRDPTLGTVRLSVRGLPDGPIRAVLVVAGEVAARALERAAHDRETHPIDLTGIDLRVRVDTTAASEARGDHRPGAGQGGPGLGGGNGERPDGGGRSPLDDGSRGLGLAGGHAGGRDDLVGGENGEAQAPSPGAPIAARSGRRASPAGRTAVPLSRATGTIDLRL